MQTNPRDSRQTARLTLAIGGTGRAQPQMSPRQIIARRDRNAPGLASRTAEERAAHREVCSAAGLPY
jgi:hypothetical protein